MTFSDVIRSLSHLHYLIYIILDCLCMLVCAYTHYVSVLFCACSMGSYLLLKHVMLFISALALSFCLCVYLSYLKSNLQSLRRSPPPPSRTMWRTHKYPGTMWFLMLIAVHKYSQTNRAFEIIAQAIDSLIRLFHTVATPLCNTDPACWIYRYSR